VEEGVLAEGQIETTTRNLKQKSMSLLQQGHDPIDQYRPSITTAAAAAAAAAATAAAASSSHMPNASYESAGASPVPT